MDGWREERRESLFPSILTGGELLNRELELEWVPETLQIQLHLERVWGGGGGLGERVKKNMRGKRSGK